jgi:hypothetical protein
VLPSTSTESLPARGLRFVPPDYGSAERHKMALLACLCSHQHVFGGLTNRSLRQQLAGLIPGYSARQMICDLGAFGADRSSSGLRAHTL